jgi:hypothetical protein
LPKDRRDAAWYQRSMSVSRRTRKPAARAKRPRPRAAVRRPSNAADLASVLKFQAKSTAALRAVKMPMAVEPSFIFKP